MQRCLRFLFLMRVACHSVEAQPIFIKKELQAKSKAVRNFLTQVVSETMYYAALWAKTLESLADG